MKLSIVKKIIKYFYCGLGVILWGLLFVSCAIEIKSGGSIFRSCIKCGWETPNFLNLEAIGAVAETIGITSILIVWLYSSFDKVELGLKYIDILRNKYKFYYVFTASHVVSILITIWASKTVALEIGLLSLSIVCWGCVAHGAFLWELLFNPNARKQLSIQKWKRDIEKSDSITLKKTVYNLVDIVDINENVDTVTACELVSMVMKKIETKIKYQDTRYLVADYYSVWQNLLEKHSDEKRTIITQMIFSNLNKTFSDKEKNSVFYICAGYILWLYNYTLSNQDCQNKEEATLTNMLIQLDKMYYDSNCTFDVLRDILLTFFYTLMWLIFVNKKICLNSNLLNRCNNFKSIYIENIDLINNYITDMAKCLHIVDEKEIIIALTQMKK